jgi:hypothetical protein
MLYFHHQCNNSVKIVLHYIAKQTFSVRASWLRLQCAHAFPWPRNSLGSRVCCLSGAAWTHTWRVRKKGRHRVVYPITTHAQGASVTSRRSQNRFMGRAFAAQCRRETPTGFCRESDVVTSFDSRTGPLFTEKAPLRGNIKPSIVLKTLLSLECIKSQIFTNHFDANQLMEVGHVGSMSSLATCK